MLTISFGFMKLLFIPVVVSFPWYPPLITSWSYRCDQVYHLDSKDYVKIAFMGGLNLFLLWQLFWDALVHGEYLANTCYYCMLEYIYVIEA